MPCKKVSRVKRYVKIKDINGKIIKGRLSGKVQHFGDDRQFLEVVDRNNLRYYALKKNIKKIYKKNKPKISKVKNAIDRAAAGWY